VNLTRALGAEIVQGAVRALPFSLF
jgi:hypothetical protein